MSVTELGTRRRCGWRWEFESFNGRALTPLLPPTALDLGRMIHEAHARWEIAWFDALKAGKQPNVSLMLLFMQLEQEATTHVRNKWLAARGAPLPDEHMEALQRDVFDMGRAMCENYESFYGQPCPPNFVVIQPEQTIIVDVPGTEHDREYSHRIKDWITCPHPAADYVQWAGDLSWQLESEVMEQEGDLDSCVCTEINGVVTPLRAHIAECNGVHQLECTLDALIQNIETGVVFVRERKTWDKHPTMRELTLNDQFVNYGWVMNQEPVRAMIEAVSVKAVADFGGLAYDGMWKRMLPGQARMVQGDSDDPGGNLALTPVKYDSGTFLAKGRPFEDLFLRLLLPFGERYLESAHVNLINQFLDFSTNPYLYPDRRWAGCWDCNKALDALCEARLNHEPEDEHLVNFTLRQMEHRKDIWPAPEPIKIKAA